jgi:DNA-binding response OmpR family regulator
MRVLVVEDSQSLAEVLVEGLRDQGMAVDAAHDGLEAAAKLDLNPYDVVVLDRDLPGIHGDVLCQMITDRRERAMVLMLTAAGAPGDRVTGLGLGADDYLGKPFHFPELVLRIRALARRQLDPSVKEFGVLEALLAAAPAFLRAEELLEQVWDEQADPFTNLGAKLLQSRSGCTDCRAGRGRGPGARFGRADIPGAVAAAASALPLTAATAPNRAAITSAASASLAATAAGSCSP